MSDRDEFEAVTYTVDGITMSQLEYIAWLHDRLEAARAPQAVHPDHMELLRPFMSQRDGRLTHSLTVYLQEMSDPEFRKRIHEARRRLYQKQAAVPALTDEQIKEAADGADYSTMVTADDFIYVLARAVLAAAAPQPSPVPRCYQD